MKIQNKSKYVIFIIILIVIFFLFYWYEIRPLKIKRICQTETTEKIKEEIPIYQTKYNFNYYYNLCLDKYNIPPLNTISNPN